MKTADRSVIAGARLAAVLSNANIFEWERMNEAQNRRDRANLMRGFAWALLFSTVFWGVVALWVAL